MVWSPLTWPHVPGDQVTPTQGAVHLAPGCAHLPTYLSPGQLPGGALREYLVRTGGNIGKFFKTPKHQFKYLVFVLNGIASMGVFFLQLTASLLK